jgi:hypothetical protein
MKHGAWVIGATAALLAAISAGWYLGSPWWTMWRMREAARAGDMQTLASYVDADAVKRAALADARSRLGEGIGRVLADRSGDLGAALRSEWRRQIQSGGGRGAIDWVKDMRFSARDLIGGPAGPNPTMVQHSFDQFSVRERNRPSPGLFTFRRHGLGWKLAAVRLGDPS